MRLENCLIYDNVTRTYNQMRLLGMKKNQTHLLVFLLILVYAHFITRFSYRIRKNLPD